MAADVVPALNDEIMTSFRSRMNKDARIRRVSKRIKDGTATLQDGHTYAAAQTGALWCKMAMPFRSRGVNCLNSGR